MTSIPELEKAIDALPARARTELSEFVQYLRYKVGIEPPGPVVQLGGLWAGIPFDITDEDVRALRQRVTTRVAGKRELCDESHDPPLE